MSTLTLKPSKRLKYSFKTKPYSHQKKALNKILQLGGKGALFMEMGTGKTKVAIDWAGIAFYNSGARRVLVVAPLSVLGVWPRQIRQHSPVPARCFRVEGKTRDRLYLLKLLLRQPADDKLTWLIINYEGIWRAPDRGYGVEQLLVKWKPDLIIFDESHRLKNPMSKQSRSAARITRALPGTDRLVLTGTPITKSPLDSFGQYRVLDEKIFGTGDVRGDWKNFRNWYGRWGGFGKHKLLGYKHVNELVDKIRTWSYRIRKEQCFDLPPKVYQDIPVTLSPRAAKIYDTMAKEMIVELESGVYATATIVLAKLTRLSQITSGFVKDSIGIIRELDDSKLRACMDLVQDLLDGEHKIVIFVRWLQDIKKISEKLDKMDVPHRILSGSVPPKHRDRIVQEFQRKKKVKVFIAQIQSGSEGIELTAADVAIYFSMNYSALNYWQSQDRLHRPGAEKYEKITYYRLVVPHSIDTLTYQILQEKGNLAKAVLHDPQLLRP